MSSRPPPTKFTPLTSGRDVMARPELLRQSMNGEPSAARLTLIVAPAGFGKTTLLREQRSAFESIGFRTVWLNCDDGDRDPGVFVDSVSNALQHAGIRLRRTPRSPEEISRQCEALPYRVALFIDDFDVVTSDPHDAALEAIARSAPANLALVVAARFLRTRPFVALELDGCVRLIDAALLRFSEREARAFLEGLASEETMSDLVARADGWPFVLQLLRMHALKRSQPGRAAGDIVLPASRISEYLASEVMSQLDDALREFVIETSLLPVVSLNDAIALTARDNCASLLRRLEALVPIVTLEHSPPVARFHPLFREHLRAELDARGQSVVIGLHERLACYYERTQRVAEAVQCAVSGGLIDRAVSILERAGGVRLVMSFGLTEARRTLQMLPKSAVEGRLRLRLMTIGTLILRGRDEDASRELAAIEAELQEGRFEGQIDEIASTDLAAARSLVEYVEIEHSTVRTEWDVLRDATQRAAEVSRNDPRLWVLPLTIEINLLLRQGSLPRAVPLIDTYVTVAEREKRSWTSPDAWLYRAMSHLAHGELDDAEWTAGRVVMTLRNRDGHEEGHTAQVAHAVMGQIRYLRNDIRGAIAHIDAIPTHLPYGTFDVYTTQHVWRALCNAATGDADTALDRLDTALVVAAERRLPHLSMLANAVRHELLETNSRELRTPQQSSTEHEPLVVDDEQLHDDAIPWVTRGWLARASVVALLARERHGEALRVAEAFVAATSGSSRRLLKAGAWLLVARACGPTESRIRTLDAVTSALSLAAETGAYRLFLDAGPEVIGWVCECAQSGAGGAAACARQIVSTLTPMDLLSSRQKAVLRELCKGRSNKEIARALRLSPETVKWYLKGIFERLGVTTRGAVVRAAFQIPSLAPRAFQHG